MNWQVVEDGLRAWTALMTATPVAFVAWNGAPVGYRTYNQVDLRLYDHRPAEGITPEVKYPDPVPPATQIKPVVVAQRTVSWSITLTTRDQHANAKAGVLLDQLAAMLALPYSTDCFTALGLSIVDQSTVTSGDPPDQHRELSQATLVVDFGYVLCVQAPDAAMPAAGVDIIEHAEVGGTAVNVTEPIEIPPEMMPPIA